jgi:N-acetylglutamate synthase-like GNAT family acetyltransferase
VLITVVISIRLANRGDADAIASAYRESRREAFTGLIPAEAVLPRTRDDDVRRWREFAESAAGKLFVAESHGAILGVAALEYAGSTAELGALYVHPSAYRNGAGSALLQEVLAAAAPTYPEVIAWILASNRRAKDFFIARGGWLDGGTEIRSIGSQAAQLVMQRIRFRTDPGAR